MSAPSRWVAAYIATEHLIGQPFLEPEPHPLQKNGAPGWCRVGVGFGDHSVTVLWECTVEIVGE